MPAAAVIPALRAYIKVVAFKTPVVEIAWWGLKGGFFLEGKGRRGQEKRRVRRVCVCVCAHTHHRACASGEERKEERGGEEKACVLSFTRERIQLLNKTSLSLSFSDLGVLLLSVCAEHPLSSTVLPLSSPGQHPPRCPSHVFCYHKEIGVSIAGRALVAQAPVHCSME